MDIEIRDAASEDAAALAVLLDQLGYPSTQAEVTGRLAHLASTGSDECFVALRNGEVVGMAAVHVSATLVDDNLVAKLNAIVVDQLKHARTTHRGRNRGRRREDAGAASGLIIVSRQLGGSLGLGVLVTVFATAADGLAHGVSVSLTIGAVMLALALVVAAARGNRWHPTATVLADLRLFGHAICH
jgi:hypothetical protein